MTERIAIGVDLGGTYIKAGLVTETGQSLGGWKEPTGAAGGPQAVLDALLAVTRKILRSEALRERLDAHASRLAGIGIGSPGVVDPRSGVVRKATSNLPGWEGTQIGPVFEKEFGLKAFLDNDANAYVWGEYLFGAGKDRQVRNLLGLTLGTGVGGGVVVDGRLLHGAHGCAGELGHIVASEHDDSLLCSCGNQGCLESYASARGLVADVLGQAEANADSLIFQLVARPQEVTAETIHRAALQGDALALRVIERAATFLGRGLAGLICCFDPEIVVIGGGVANLGKLLFERVEKIVRQRVFFSPLTRLEILPARLGADAGYKGAAGLALFPSE